ncbi:MAG: winged helix-turn-helix domain-containing protein [Candidatus Bathyarchaeia archaeon]
MLKNGRELNSVCLSLHKKYRSHIDLIALILEGIRNGKNARYSLMKYANVNYSQLRKYLEVLARIGFIEIYANDGKIFYKACEKGLLFLRQYEILRDMLLNAFPQNRQVNLVYKECKVVS